MLYIKIVPQNYNFKSQNKNISHFFLKQPLKSAFSAKLMFQLD